MEHCTLPLTHLASGMPGYKLHDLAMLIEVLKFYYVNFLPVASLSLPVVPWLVHEV